MVTWDPWYEAQQKSEQLQHRSFAAQHGGRTMPGHAGSSEVVDAAKPHTDCHTSTKVFTARRICVLRMWCKLHTVLSGLKVTSSPYASDCLISG